MANPNIVRKLINKTFSSRFVISRLSRFSPFGRILDALLFRGDDLVYLPDDRAVPIHRALSPPDSVVMPSAVLSRLIDAAHDHWIMNFCICRESAGCRDYPHHLGCLFMGRSAMEINPAWGRRVDRSEAIDHVARCRELGLIHLVGRNRLDAVWLNAWPMHRLLTVCNCCPCCCLWTILPDINPEIGRKVSRMPGTRMRVTERCTGCGTCERLGCFVDAIHVIGSRARIDEHCRGCGRCAAACPQGAIELEILDDDYIRKTADRLRRAVDLG